ncbi:MAG: hypothetical protein U0075_07395 [Thermomicrobiales bacterium]
MSSTELALLTRRASLSVLGALGAAGLSMIEPGGIAAKSSARKKARKRCQKDTSSCVTIVQTECADQVDPAACVSAFTPCCATCSATGFAQCLFNLAV